MCKSGASGPSRDIAHRSSKLSVGPNALHASYRHGISGALASPYPYGVQGRLCRAGDTVQDLQQVRIQPAGLGTKQGQSGCLHHNRRHVLLPEPEVTFKPVSDRLASSTLAHTVAHAVPRPPGHHHKCSMYGNYARDPVAVCPRSPQHIKHMRVWCGSGRITT